MISAIFSAQPLLLLALAASSLALAAIGFLLGLRFDRPKRFFWALTGAATGAALAATLTPARETSGYSGTCTISKDFLQAVGTEQWLLNLALLAPVCLFLILAGSSCASAVASTATLSLAIEFTQAAIPGIGRACDSDDLIANTLGAVFVAAVMLVVSVSRRDRSNVRSKMLGSGRTLTVNGAALAIVAIAGFSALTMTFVDSTTPIKEADSEQRRAAVVALEAIFGKNFHVTRVQISNLPNDYGAGRQNLIASWENGNAEISWPDAKIHKMWSSTGVAITGHRDPVDISNDAAAKTLARDFAAKNFAWTGAATDISAKMDSQSPGARRITYVQKRDGIVMPMRFSMVLSGKGRLLELTADEARAPGRIPPVRTALAAASRTAASHAPPGSRRSATELRLLKRGSTWFTVWAFTYSRSGDAGNSSYNPVLVLVNATTGKLLPSDASAFGASG